ncbi:MAG TPA: holo-ACP synthase [Ktedonobacterales bacterium]|jgi:holo-[acyl-carrier protein] synthase
MTTGDAESSHASDAPAQSDAPGESFHPPAVPVAVTVGVDLVEVERLVRTWERFGDHFLHKVFTETELDQAKRRVRRLVGRFAAKEACAKALGTGIGAIRWHDIEIIRLPTGKPGLRLHGAAAERARLLGLVAFDVSISDTHEHAIAVVVGVGNSSSAAEV